MRLHPARAVGLLRAPWIPGWSKDPLWRRARAVPSLDLRFADNKSLVDATTGASLVTFTRASEATFVNSQGLIETAANNVPRFDHDPTTGESLGLLVEEQRQNLMPSSVYTSNANGWTNGVIGGSGTIASAIVANKAGNTNGVFGISGLNETSYVGCFVSTVSSTNTYTASVFVKNNGGTVFQMRLISQNGGTFKSSATQYTFATGAWQDGIAGTAAPVSRTVQDMGDGWLRFSITAADNGTGNTQTALLLFGETTTTNYNYYIWGAQLEAGSFPTSYIPTEGTTVTRAADVASISGSNFSSWYNQSEGTVFAEGAFVPAGPTNFPRLASLTGTNAGLDEISIYSRIGVGSGNGSIFGAITVNASLEGDLGSPVGSPDLSSAYRSALAYRANDFSISSNGLTPTVDNSGSLPPITQLVIMGNVRFQNRPTGHISRLAYFDRRLPDAILQAITL